MVLGAERDPFTFKTAMTETPPLSQKWRDQEERLFGETDEDQKLVKVQQLRDKIKEYSPQLLATLPPGGEDVFLLRTLRASKEYNIDSAVKMLETYVQMIHKSPQFFDMAFERFKESHAISQAVLGTVLPHRDQHGRRVMICRGGKWSPTKIPFEDMFCMLWMCLELMAREEKSQVAGLTVIIDGADFGWKQFRGITLEGLIFITNMLQDSYPLWIRQISVVNSPWLFQKLYEWIRPWLNTEVKEMLVFHQNYEELHKFVEKSILPEDYGGQTGPLDNAEVSKALQDMEGYFQDLKKYVRQCN